MKLTIRYIAISMVLFLVGCIPSQYSKRMVRVKPSNKTETISIEENTGKPALLLEKNDFMSDPSNSTSPTIMPAIEPIVIDKRSPIKNTKSNRTEVHDKLKKASEKIKILEKINKKSKLATPNNPAYLDTDGVLIIAFIFGSILAIIALFALFVPEIWPIFFLIAIIFGLVFIYYILANL
jgi:PBP1b-binding outer membrane lipoprotein LpoB